MSFSFFVFGFVQKGIQFSTTFSVLGKVIHRCDIEEEETAGEYQDTLPHWYWKATDAAPEQGEGDESDCDARVSQTFDVLCQTIRIRSPFEGTDGNLSAVSGSCCITATLRLEMSNGMIADTDVAEVDWTGSVVNP